MSTTSGRRAPARGAGEAPLVVLLGWQASLPPLARAERDGRVAAAPFQVEPDGAKHSHGKCGRVAGGARSSPKRVKKEEEGEAPAAAGPGGDRCGTVGRSRRAFRNGLAADPGEISPDETREQGETSSSTRAWLPRSSPLRSAPRPTTWTGRGEEPPPSSANLTLSSGPLDKLWWGEPPWCAGKGGGGSSARLIAAAASASCCRRTVGDTAALSSGLSSEGVALTLSGTGCPGGGMLPVGVLRPKCSAMARAIRE